MIEDENQCLLACLDEACAEKVCCKPKKVTPSENGSISSSCSRRSRRSRCSTPIRQSPMHSPRPSTSRNDSSIDQDSKKSSIAEIDDLERNPINGNQWNQSKGDQCIGEEKTELTHSFKQLGVVDEQKIDIVVHSPKPKRPPPPQSPRQQQSALSSITHHENR